MLQGKLDRVAEVADTNIKAERKNRETELNHAVSKLNDSLSQLNNAFSTHKADILSTADQI